MPADAGQRLGREWAKMLGEVPLFRGLSQRHLGRIASLAVGQRREAGSAIVHAGAASDAFYVVLGGIAVVRRPGRRAIRLRPGDFFGEIGLLDGGSRTATVEAETDVELVRLPRAGFLKMLEKEPQVALALLTALAARLREASGAPAD